MIEITAEAVERVEAILEGVPNGAERALSNAINRGISRVKTGAIRRVKEIYTVQSGAFNEATRIRVNKASTGNLAGFVSFAGYKIPLYKFKVTPTAPGVKKQVRAAVMKGGGTPFEDAFIAQMRSGDIGVFERETRKRFPIEEKMGLSAAQMVGNEKVIETLEEEAQQLVNQRLEHEINRLLSGYGG
ncbi:phage tail protein [Dialister invisus]|uniref:phage tail protein n=1 Tax=Dialister invisus TaxID=218538 RepID=UPI002675B762|nr:phage tail protein [Dialister invisus]